MARIDRSVRRWLVAPVRAHSEKPHEFYALIERLFGLQRRVDVFARRRRPGWDALGDEIDGMDIIDAMQAVAPSAPPPLPVSPWFGRLAVSHPGSLHNRPPTHLPTEARRTR